MLRLPSLQREYDEYYSGDPAFVQPPPMPPEGASPADIALVIQLRVEHAHRITVARDTGDWSPLMIEGETPTRFVMRPLVGELYRNLRDLFKDRTVGVEISNHVVFRAALRRVHGLGDLKVELELHENPELEMLGKIAGPAIPNALDAIDRAIVNELAVAAFEKGGRSSPK